ncbi:hypothetical protein SS50377_20319 [Spironucleus salmonicida]|uniref:Uncharacterized protein n=1 Tax=Spironucleus salmonicida TaxID=348837 RepID=V6LH14_9EUKA|nr:hypothetical protein SS50377_20319 [Spironucleus salmonicida]|eukprot:EST43001.1 hypothetical protein SS50377_17302 [Spironucleus salmonicida]
MDKLLQIAEEIIQLLPRELLAKYHALKQQMLKGVVIAEIKSKSQLDDISFTSFRNKLDEYQYLKKEKYNIGTEMEVEIFNKAIEVVDTEKEFLVQQLEFMQNIKLQNQQCQTQQQYFHQTTQSDFIGKSIGIQENPQSLNGSTNTEEPEHYQKLATLIMSLDKSNNQIDQNQPQILFKNVTNLHNELELFRDESELWKQKFKQMQEQYNIKQSQQKELEQVFNQVLKETNKFKDQDLILKDQATQIIQFEDTIVQLQIKLQESEIMQKKAQDAYFVSMQQLKRKSDQQMSRLQEQLAVTHDRLRKIQKNVESVDSSLFDSLLSK